MFKTLYKQTINKVIIDYALIMKGHVFSLQVYFLDAVIIINCKLKLKKNNVIK
jgi:hypothetical protein